MPAYGEDRRSSCERDPVSLTSGPVEPYVARVPRANRNPEDRTAPFRVQPSRIAGQGAFATRPIDAGEWVIEYAGERIPEAEFQRRDPARRPGDAHHTVFFEVAADVVIDASVGGNGARFINHSCDPSCETRIEEGRLPSMTRLWIGIAISLITGCTASGVDNDKTPARDTVAPVDTSGRPTSVVVGEPIETTAKRAIAAISAHDMATLSSLVHPTRGLRFSPYQYVDQKADRSFTREQVKDLWAGREISIWGTHDGSGEPLRLTYPDYHRAFVYDADYLRAPKVAVDSEPMGRGTTANNIRTVYPDASVVEYHFPGSDPTMGGLDWKSLWLVFQKQGSSWYLVGIAHGAWTT
jgi:hypothetical protein